jgi:hypothetical protein
VWELVAEPSEGQRTVLSIVYQAFGDYGQWPVFQYVETVADHEYGLDATELIQSMPPGLLFPDPSVVGQISVVANPGQTLALTIRGLTYCDAREDLDLFIAIIDAR